MLDSESSKPPRVLRIQTASVFRRNMGNESSTLSPVGGAAAEEGGLALFDAQDGESAVEAGDSCAFRVLGIQERSPAAAAGFVSFFDFILEANGIRLDTKDSTLMELIAQSEDRPLALRVYNVKSQTTRGEPLSLSLSNCRSLCGGAEG